MSPGTCARHLLQAQSLQEAPPPPSYQLCPWRIAVHVALLFSPWVLQVRLWDPCVLPSAVSSAVRVPSGPPVAWYSVESLFGSQPGNMPFLSTTVAQVTRGTGASLGPLASTSCSCIFENFWLQTLVREVW